MKVLHQILEDVQGDDSYLDDSSMTQPTPTPQRPTDTREESNQQHLKGENMMNCQINLTWSV